MPIDYSRWKDIEISDDEDDTHPNVDTPSLFKWRHDARVQRMSEENERKAEVKENISTYVRKIETIKKYLSDEGISEEKRKTLQEELEKTQQEELKWLKREEELEELERTRPWNVDTIGQEGFTVTRINKVQPSIECQPSSASDLSEEEETKNYESNLKLAKKFLKLHTYKEYEDFLIANPSLCSDVGISLLSIICLDNELLKNEEVMTSAAQKAILIRYLLEYSKFMNVEAKNSALIQGFFKKINFSVSNYTQLFDEDVTIFKEKIKQRAKEKIAEAEKESEEEARKERLGPGGLDPLEVLETLPPEMKDCFESQDREALKRVALDMDYDDFCKHFQRCIDSGLWVANDSDESAEDIINEVKVDN